MKRGEKQESGKLVKQMNIVQDKRNTRVTIPEFLVEIFDINPKGTPQVLK